MKPYSKYKASGVEWIGDIPESWSSWKLSHAIPKIGSGTTPEAGNPIYHENGNINWLNTGDLNDGIIYSCSKKITDKAIEDYTSLKIYPSGSLVMAMYGATIGKTSIIMFDTTTNQACCVFSKSDIIDIKFLQFWFLGNKEFIINLAIGGGQPNISQNILKDIRIFCPTLPEQTIIANFLDRKTTELDTLIANKKSLIELLKEERTAIINHAITKGISGLNHDSLDLLDSKDYENQENQSNPKNHGSDNVRYKDSGIEWIGEIPEHWEVKRLRYLAKICNGQDQKAVLDEDGKYPIYGSGGIFGRANTFLYDKPSVLLGRKGTIDKPRLVIEPFWSVDTAFYTKIFDNVSVMYFYYLCCSINFDLYKYGSAVPSMTQGYLNEIKFSIPKLEEQNDIVKFIETKTTEIDTIISQTEKEIDLLKEYKTALISEVVLGKVDVRE